MELKVKDGQVRFIMVAGSDYVEHKMFLAEAQKIVKKGKATESKLFEGFPLCVDDMFYFECEPDSVRKGGKGARKESGRKESGRKESGRKESGEEGPREA